jgi:hypothetical protein
MIDAGIEVLLVCLGCWCEEDQAVILSYKDAME